jgi:hypothetical protein
LTKVFLCFEKLGPKPRGKKRLAGIFCGGLAIKKLASAVVAAAIALSAGAVGAVPLTRADFAAAATDINFDDPAGGTSIFTGDPVSSQYAAKGITFVNPNFPTLTNAMPIGSSAITDSKPYVDFIEQGSGVSGPNVPPQELLFRYRSLGSACRSFSRSGQT